MKLQKQTDLKGGKREYTGFAYSIIKNAAEDYIVLLTKKKLECRDVWHLLELEEFFLSDWYFELAPDILSDGKDAMKRLQYNAIQNKKNKDINVVDVKHRKAWRDKFEIVKLHKAGYFPSEIGERYGIPAKDIKTLIKSMRKELLENGVSTKVLTQREEKEKIRIRQEKEAWKKKYDEIIRLYEEGLTKYEISKKMKLSFQTVLNTCRKYGLE